MALPASLITAHTSSWGSQQRQARGAASQPTGTQPQRNAGKERQGPGLEGAGFPDLGDLPWGQPGWLGSPGDQVLGAEPKGSEAEPQMTEGGAHESRWGLGGVRHDAVVAVPRLAMHGAR